MEAAGIDSANLLVGDLLAHDEAVELLGGGVLGDLEEFGCVVLGNGA